MKKLNKEEKMTNEPRLCRWCGKKVYYDLKLCTFHGAKELSEHFIKQPIELGKSRNYFGADIATSKT